MAGEIAKRLRDRRQNVWEQAKELADRAADENRAFDASEQGTWDALNEELDKLDKRIKSVLDGEKRAKEADDAFDALSGKPAARSNSAGNAMRGGTDEQLRSFLSGAPGAPRAFDVTPTGAVDFRTLSKLTAGAGANTVPTSFYNRLVAHLIETAGLMRTNPTVLNTNSGETIQIPKTTAHSSAAIVTEGATIAASDPAFGQLSLGTYKYGTLMQVSRELLADSGVDLEGYLAMQAGRALGNQFGANLITGTGTGQPRGVVVDATLGVTGGTGVVGAFTADNLIDLYFSVIAPYRASSSAAWLMKDSSLGNARKLKDGSGRYLFEPASSLDAPDTILGKPIITDPTMPATATTAKSVLFGDFSQYFVRMAGGIRFERSDDFAFNTDLVTFRALLRGDGALVDLTGAVKYFAGGAT